MMHGQQNVKS